jgi:hypothetical protein
MTDEIKVHVINKGHYVVGGLNMKSSVEPQTITVPSTI